VLQDLADQIVVPAFTDATLRREFGSTRYFFLDVGLAVSADSVSADSTPLRYLYGRLVKDTVLTREQVYSPVTGLTQAPQTLPSAPSSFFTLILDNHKMIYFPETAGAPAMGAFQSTLQRFLMTKYRQYINALFAEYKEQGEPISKKQLYIEIPAPQLEVLHLTSRASIEDFVAAFDKITHVEFKILATNDEFQMQHTYEELRSLKRSIGAKSTKLVHDNPEGLDPKNTMEQIHAATATGNQKAVLAGISHDGVKLRGNNDDFKVSVPVDLPSEDPARAAQMVELFKDQTERGIIAVDVPSDADQKS